MPSLPRPKLTFLGHSTVRCEMPDGKVMLIDPWVDNNPACPDELKGFDRLDSVLITHGHADHMGDAVEICKRHEPSQVVANFEICQWLSAQGVENCQPMNTGGSLDVGGCKVTMVYAIHSSSIQDGDRLIYGGIAGGYIVRLPEGYTFYHAGDTALFGDMQLLAELHRPQLALLPIGDLFTMDAAEAARACRFLGVRQVIPIHYGTFPVLTGKPEELEAALADIGVRCDVIPLQPGETH